MHIATHCVHDARSAIAVAKALGVRKLVLPDDVYLKTLNNISPSFPWSAEDAGAWHGFSLEIKTQKYVPGNGRRGEIFVVPHRNQEGGPK